MNKRQKDGATLREHLQSVARQTGVIPQELEPVPCPDQMLPLWGVFVELDGGRTGGALGANPLTWGDLQAFMACTGCALDSFDVAALRALDTKFLAMSAVQ